MELFLNIITNAIFITVLGFIFNYIFAKKLNSQQNDFQARIEKLKNDLNLSFIEEQDKIEQKRSVYISLIDTMSIFISGRIEQKKT